MREQPQIFSEPIGLRLCGIALDPFCPLLKYSSTSLTSVLCKCLISIAIFSKLEAINAKVA